MKRAKQKLQSNWRNKQADSQEKNRRRILLEAKAQREMWMIYIVCKEKKWKKKTENRVPEIHERSQIYATGD